MCVGINYLRTWHRISSLWVADLLTDESDEQDDDEGGDGDAACQDDEGRAHDLLQEVCRVEHLNLHRVQDLADVVFNEEESSN